MVRMNDHSENIDSQAEDDVDLLDSIQRACVKSVADTPHRTSAPKRREPVRPPRALDIARGTHRSDFSLNVRNRMHDFFAGDCC